MSESIRLVALVSGGGTTLQNLIDRIAAGTLPATIAGVVSSRADAFGVTRAEKGRHSGERGGEGERGA